MRRLSHADIQQRARALGDQLRREDGLAAATAAITRYATQHPG
jgi:hypothetical protein